MWPEWINFCPQTVCAWPLDNCRTQNAAAARHPLSSGKTVSSGERQPDKGIRVEWDIQWTGGAAAAAAAAAAVHAGRTVEGRSTAN